MSPDADASISVRVAACVAKLKETGGLSIPYFTQLAADMGYTVEIVEPWPFMAGIGRAGDVIYDADIIWCWRVDVQDASVPVYYFRAGQGAAGDSIMYFGSTAIEAVFEDLKPAHTFVYFRYPYWGGYLLTLGGDYLTTLAGDRLLWTTPKT